MRKNILPWHSKRIVHSLFCVFQTKLNKAVNIFCRLPEWIRNLQWYQVLLQDLDENVDGNLNKDLDENLAWLTQKNEDLKSNNGNLTFTSHTVNVTELNIKIIKKVATPPFLHQPPPPFQVYPPFLAKNFVPSPKWLNFSKVLPHPTLPTPL